MILVALRRSVYSDAEGRFGTWMLVTERRFAALPRAGDWLEPAPGWGTVQVLSVTFDAAGHPSLTLAPVSTNDPAFLDELAVLVVEHGWRQLGGPSRDPPEGTAGG